MNLITIVSTVIFAIAFCKSESNSSTEDKSQTKRSISQTFLSNPKFARVFNGRALRSSLSNIFLQNPNKYDTFPVRSKYIHMETPKVDDHESPEVAESLSFNNVNDEKWNTIYEDKNSEVNQTDKNIIYDEVDEDPSPKVPESSSFYKENEKWHTITEDKINKVNQTNENMIYYGVDEDDVIHNQNVTETPITEFLTREYNFKFNANGSSGSEDSTIEIIPIVTTVKPLLADVGIKNLLENNAIPMNVNRISEETTISTDINYGGEAISTSARNATSKNAVTTESTLQFNKFKQDVKEPSAKSTLKLDNAAKEKLFKSLTRRLLKSMRPIDKNTNNYKLHEESQIVSADTTNEKNTNNFFSKENRPKETSALRNSWMEFLMQAIGINNINIPYNTTTGVSVKQHETNSGLRNFSKIWQQSDKDNNVSELEESLNRKIPRESELNSI